jgi:multiple sugar transport system permease protein
MQAAPTWIDQNRYLISKRAILILITIFSLLFLSPLLWTIATSLRIPAESFSLPPKWIPTNPRWENYNDVFTTAPFGSYILNSILVTTGCVVGQLCTATLAGYAFARLKFPGREVFFWLILATMMIPLQATIIPVFVLISKMGLADNLWALILPALPAPFGVFLLRQYFTIIPIELEEAAVIDGANPLQIFWKIHLPLAKTGMAVQGMLSFNYFWNEFFRPLIFLTNRENFTLPIGLVDLRGYFSTGSISVVLAGVVLSLIPVLIIFVFGQRYLIEGIMRSGLKG